MLFTRRADYVLVVGDEGVLLYSARGGASQFAAINNNVARHLIQKQLEENPKARVTVLMNGAAQEFRVETLPPVSVFDRGKLIARRLQQAFPSAYATASRAMDSAHALVANVHQGNALAGWCQRVLPENLALGSLPIEGGSLLAQLVPTAAKGWTLLLAHFKTGGLRQIVMCDGQLVFTRQTPAMNDLPRLIDDTRGYLKRFGLGEDGDLHVIAVLGAVERMALSQDNIIRTLTLLSPRQAAEKLRLARLPAEDEGDADLVFAVWAARQGKLWLPIKPPAIRQQQRETLIANLVRRTALAVLVLALGLNGWRFKDLALQFYENQRSVDDIARSRTQLAAQQTAAPAVKSLQRLRAALERQRIFAEPQPEPWGVLRQLAQVIDGKARVSRFDWHDEGGLEIDLRLSDDANNADRRTIVAGFKSLADQITQLMPDYNVSVTRYPFPATSEDTLTNIGGEAAAVAPIATLFLRKRP